jgi:hypothetical protein
LAVSLLVRTARRSSWRDTYTNAYNG